MDAAPSRDGVHRARCFGAFGAGNAFTATGAGGPYTDFSSAGTWTPSGCGSFTENYTYQQPPNQGTQHPVTCVYNRSTVPCNTDGTTLLATLAGQWTTACAGITCTSSV